MKSFLDSNVLVYLFDQDAPRKKATAQQILQTEGTVGNIAISTQVLQEFYVTVTRKLAQPLKADTALEAVDRFVTLPLVVVDAAFDPVGNTTKPRRLHFVLGLSDYRCIKRLGRNVSGPNIFKM